MSFSRLTDWLDQSYYNPLLQTILLSQTVDETIKSKVQLKAKITIN